MKLIERLAGNTVYLFADWAAVTALSFVFWVMVWKSLPPEAAGIISTTLNMIILISTFGIFGMHATLTKLISEYSGRNRQDRVNALIRFSNKILILINVAVSVGFLAAVTYFGIDLKIPFPAVVAVSIGIILWPLTHATTSILQGFQNMRLIFRTDAVSNVVKLVGTGLLIWAGLNYIGPIAAIIVSYAAVVVMRRDVLQIGRRIKEGLIRRREVIYRYALPALVASLSWALFINTPTIILALFDSLKSSGLFSAAVSLANPLAFLPSIIATALFPIISSLSSSRNKSARQARMIETVIRYVSFISAPLIIVYVFFAKYIIIVFTQLQYLDAVSLIPIVGFAVLVQSIGQVFIQSLFAIGNARANRNVYMATTAFFLLTSIPATMAVGIMGLVWSFVASVLFFTGLGYAILRRSMRFSIPWGPVAKVAAASLPLLAMLVLGYMADLRFFGLLIPLAIGAAAYFVVLRRLGFYSAEDVAIMRFAEKRAPRIGGAVARIREWVQEARRGPFSPGSAR